jgi:hypothetical protein
MCSDHSQRANSNCRSAMYQVSAVDFSSAKGWAVPYAVRWALLSESWIRLQGR